MDLIDFHTHVFPDPIAAKGTRSISGFYHLEGDCPLGNADTLLRLEQEAGVSRCVILPVGMKPEQVRHVNEFAAGLAREHPQLIPFGTVHAAQEDLCQEAEYLVAQGCRGIKIHPDMQQFAIDDLRLYPLYDYLQGTLPVIFHMGDALFNYSHPIRLRRILQQFPGLTCIAAHLGGFTMYETAYENLYDQNCFLDVSSITRPLTREEARRRIRSYGAERLVFGTDFPLWDPVKEVKAFLELGLEDRELEQIGWKTACGILKADSPDSL